MMAGVITREAGGLCGVLVPPSVTRDRSDRSLLALTSRSVPLESRRLKTHFPLVDNDCSFVNFKVISFSDISVQYGVKEGENKPVGHRVLVKYLGSRERDLGHLSFDTFCHVTLGEPLNLQFFFLFGTVCVLHVYIHIDMDMSVHTSVEVRGQYWLSSSIAFYLTFLEQMLSLNLELMDWLGWLASKLQRSLVSALTGQ